jgi:hypothetical protein
MTTRAPLSTHRRPAPFCPSDGERRNEVEARVGNRLWVAVTPNDRKRAKKVRAAGEEVAWEITCVVQAVIWAGPRDETGHSQIGFPVDACRSVSFL